MRADPCTDHRRDNLTVWDGLRSVAERSPDQDAIVIDDDRVSFAELHRRALALAAGLAADGLRSRDHVVVALRDGVVWIELFYALARLGAVMVPANPRWTPSELRYVVQRTRARAVVVHGDGAHLSLRDEAIPLAPTFYTDEPGFGVAHLAEVRSDDRPLPGEPPADALALIQFTSGSTAEPKGVQLTGASICGVADAVAGRLEIDARDRVFGAVPLFHIGGTVLHLLLSHRIGATFVGIAQFNAAQALRVVERTRSTVIAAIDAHFLRMMADSTFGTTDLSSVTKALATGTGAVLRRVEREFGVRAVALYGMSETSSNTAMASIRDSEVARLDSCGYPSGGAQVAIRDPHTGVFLDPPAIGEICVRGPNVMVGYLDEPGLTAEVFHDDGWLRSGDLGSIDGGMLHFRGRVKEIIRVGGENVSLAEVESAVQSADVVVDVAIIAAEDAVLGQVPVAVVALQPGIEPPQAIAALRQTIQDLSRFKHPRHWAFIDELPYTGSGKPDRPALIQRWAADAFECVLPAIEPR